MSKIIVFGKCRSRGNLDWVLKSVNYWSTVYSDKNRYEFYIYSEDLDLPREYNSFKILRKHDLNQNIKCKKLFEMINNSRLIHDRWKGACAALSAPYFYFEDQSADLIINLDLDDTMFFGPAKLISRKVEDLILNDPKLQTLSHTLHFDFHQGDYSHFRKNHWTYGWSFSRPKFMRELILKGLLNHNIPTAPWNNNLDYVIDIQLDHINTPHIAFITKHKFSHYWASNNNFDEFAKTLKYDPSTNKIESVLVHQKLMIDKHPRTILIQ